MRSEVRMLIGLLPRQLERSFNALQDLLIERDDNGRLLIKLCAFGPFSPNCFDGMRSSLELVGPNGIGSVNVTLRVMPADGPRGTWFAYEAVFEGPGDAEQVVFTGVHVPFSNVRRLSFLAEGRPSASMANPFFRN